jgi:hypothetical protein
MTKLLCAFLNLSHEIYSRTVLGLVNPGAGISILTRGQKCAFFIILFVTAVSSVLGIRTRASK